MTTETLQIRVMLLNEGVTTAKVAPAKSLGNGVYEILQPHDYDPEDEEWEFTPGDIVRCELQSEGWEKPLLMAVEKIQ